MAGKFELYKDKGGEFRFRLVASNGNTILASEGYKVRASAEKGIASVIANAPDAKRYQSKTTAAGKFTFALTATNGNIIGASQAYDTEAARDKGIESVKAQSVGAPTVDLTAA